MTNRNRNRRSQWITSDNLHNKDNLLYYFVMPILFHHSGSFFFFFVTCIFLFWTFAGGLCTWPDRATAVNTTQVTPFANIIAMVENYAHFDLKHLGLVTRGQSWPFVLDWVFYGFLLLFQSILFRQFWLKRLKHRMINELVCMRCLTQIWLVISLILRCFFLKQKHILQNSIEKINFGGKSWIMKNIPFII